MVAGNKDPLANGEVYNLQTALTKEGFDVSGDTQGGFGDNTAAAVVAFQSKYGIRQTGTVGPLTRVKLNALYGCSVQLPTPITTPIPTPSTQPLVCSGLNTVWYAGGILIRTDVYSYSSDQCNGYRCLTGNNVSPSCYDQSQCATACSGQCINVSDAKNQCPATPIQPISQCANLYWLDNTTQNCQTQKQFCGVYMYQGLQTFASQLDCQVAALQKQLNKSCNTNSDCLSGQVCSSGVCGTAQVVGTLIPSTTFVNYNLVQGRSVQPTQITLTNSSTSSINFTISVPNQPAWLNTGYNTQPMSLQAGGVMGVGVSVDSTKVNGPGTYTTNLVFTGNFANSPITIPITLTVTSQASLPVSVVAPNGGEALTAGQTYQIKWNAPNDSASQNMQLTLANSDTGELTQIGNNCIEQGVVAPVPSSDPNARYLQGNCSGLTAPVQNTGSYTWTVPTTLPSGSHYYMYVGELKIMGDGDFSNSPFTINAVQPVTQSTGNVSTVPSTTWDAANAICQTNSYPQLTQSLRNMA